MSNDDYPDPSSAPKRGIPAAFLVPLLLLNLAVFIAICYWFAPPGWKPEP